MYEQGPIYQHTINLNNNMECVQVWGDNAQKIFDNKFENSMFYTMCDILSIDFKSLTSQLSTTSNTEQICDVLAQYHPLLIDVILTDAIKIWRSYNNMTRFPLESIEKLVDYVDKISTLNILYNPDIFNKFALSCCGTRIWNYSIGSDDKGEEIFEKAVDKKMIGRFSLDEFIERLKFEKILKDFPKLTRYSIITENILEFLCSNIYYILSHDFELKRCENCGKFFVAYNRSDTLYCDRQSPQEGKWTCKEYASKRGWYEKQRENEAAKLYRNIYQKKQMYLRRHPDLEIYKADFENFKTAAKEWKRKVKDGSAAESDYLQWLKDVKEKKVK